MSFSLMQAYSEVFARNATGSCNGCMQDVMFFQSLCMLLDCYPPCYRLIWTALLLTAGGLFTYLVVTKVQYLYSYPKTVNLEVNYNDSLVFPAVTICNTNEFRCENRLTFMNYQTKVNIHLRHIVSLSRANQFSY